MKSDTQTLKVCNERVRQHAKDLLDKLPLDPAWTVTIKPWKKDRSAAQNKLSHKHYGQIAKQMFETPRETKARCKLSYALPILLAENEEFADRWHKFSNGLSYAEMLELADEMRMTSKMNVKQMSRYINDYMFEHEQSGIQLSHPGDMWAEAMGLKR
ncbi:MAG: recombination protein NinB [Proteobacteria bacterium]|nr:recombination protein NinB [Pseudomonadota bacterium]